VLEVPADADVYSLDRCNRDVERINSICFRYNVTLNVSIRKRDGFLIHSNPLCAPKRRFTQQAPDFGRRLLKLGDSKT